MSDEPKQTPQQQALAAVAPMLIAMQPPKGKKTPAKPSSEQPGMGTADEQPGNGKPILTAGAEGKSAGKPIILPHGSAIGLPAEKTLNAQLETRMGTIDQQEFWSNGAGQRMQFIKQYTAALDGRRRNNNVPRPEDAKILADEALWTAKLSASNPQDIGMFPFQPLFELANAHFNLGERAEGQAIVNFAAKQAALLANRLEDRDKSTYEYIRQFQKEVNEHYGFKGTDGPLPMPGQASQPKTQPAKRSAAGKPAPLPGAPEATAPESVPVIVAKAADTNPRKALYDRLKADAKIYDNGVRIQADPDGEPPITVKQTFARAHAENPDSASEEKLIRDMSPVGTLRSIVEKPRSALRLPLEDTMAAVLHLDNTGNYAEAEKFVKALQSQLMRDGDKPQSRTRASARKPVATPAHPEFPNPDLATPASQYNKRAELYRSAVPDVSVKEVLTQLEQLRSSLHAAANQSLGGPSTAAPKEQRGTAPRR